MARRYQPNPRSRLVFLSMLGIWVVIAVAMQGRFAQDAVPFVAAGDLATTHPADVYRPHMTSLYDVSPPVRHHVVQPDAGGHELLRRGGRLRQHPAGAAPLVGPRSPRPVARRARDAAPRGRLARGGHVAAVAAARHPHPQRGHGARGRGRRAHAHGDGAAVTRARTRRCSSCRRASGCRAPSGARSGRRSWPWCGSPPCRSRHSRPRSCWCSCGSAGGRCSGGPSARQPPSRPSPRSLGPASWYRDFLHASRAISGFAAANRFNGSIEAVVHGWSPALVGSSAFGPVYLVAPGWRWPVACGGGGCATPTPTRSGRGPGWPCCCSCRSRGGTTCSSGSRRWRWRWRVAGRSTDRLLWWLPGMAVLSAVVSVPYIQDHPLPLVQAIVLVACVAAVPLLVEAPRVSDPGPAASPAPPQPTLAGR